MRKLKIIFLLLIFKVCPILGQTLSIGFGPTFLIDKEKVSIHPLVKGKGLGGNDDWLWQIKYEHFIKNKWIAYCSYSKYPIATSFHFFKKNEGGSVGWVGTIVNRIDLGVKYNIFSKSNFLIMPNIGFGIQNSKSKDVGFIGGDISEGIKPDNFELLEDIEAFAYSNTQIVPVIGLKFGYAFWGRLELFMDIQQVFGHKIIQELRMSYTYKGIEQPQAISYSDGTGRFYALGIGYRFVKPKEK